MKCHKIYFVLVFIFISCKLHPSEFVPCWFNQPFSNGYLGFIGVSSAYGSMPNVPLKKSRKKALEKMASYYGWDLSAEDVLNLTNQTKQLSNGFTVIFSNVFKNNGSSYSYASILNEVNPALQSKKIDKTCPIQKCEFAICQPKWLCESDSGAVFGISNMTVTPFQQYDKTRENAQQLMSYLEESFVDENVYRVQFTGKSSNFNFMRNQASVEALAVNQSKLLNTHQCRTNNFIFARYAHDNKKITKLKSFAKWIVDPHTNRQGAVGSFDGYAADGKFSTAVKSAIKDALIQLAKVKEVSIGNEYILSENNGYYSMSRTTEKTSINVSGQLMDIKIVEQNGKLIIYTWLLEQPTQGK